MKRVILAVILFLLVAGVVFAAPGVPWNYNLWNDEAISATPEAQSFTLENVSSGHIYYHFSEGVTTTAWIVVNEGWDGETEYTQSASGSTDYDDYVTGVFTLTAVYPDVTVTISTTDASGTATVGVWQR